MIYLDYNATTPIDKEVELSMLPFLRQKFGNPSSRYSLGIESRQAIENARQQVANLIGAFPDEIVFTGGGTEANNHALKGIAFANRNKGNHIIISSVEHPAISETAQWLGLQGFEITVLPVDKDGCVLSSDLEKSITDRTILISIMHANNEVGTIQPIAELTQIARKYGVLFHTDAAQSAGKIKIDVNEMGVDMLSIAGHKLYAPKGIGALYIKRGVKLDKLIHGAGQEQGLRAGTENILEIVGLGKAAEIALRDFETNTSHLSYMRDTLYQELMKLLPELYFNTDVTKSLPNTLSISFRGVAADTILSLLPELAVSAGAACHQSGVTVSQVLQAMNVPVEYAMGTIRLSTGKYTSENDIKEASQMLAKAYNSLVVDNSESYIDIQNETIKLTQFTHGLGCACKMGAEDLGKVLATLNSVYDEKVLVGKETLDDATVYKINDNQAIVQTVDFFSPIVDNAYDFGAIAAANALSDVYAMGAKPLFALNIVAFPKQRLPLSVLEQILKGASDKASEAGIAIVGGHSIEDTEPKFGMCVTGMLHPKNIWRNMGALLGDVLILTKPIGIGVITTAAKNSIAESDVVEEAIYWMKMLNKQSAEILTKYEVHACTDVTGFGLMGHMFEMLQSSKVNADIYLNKIPYMPNVAKLAAMGAVPGGTYRNLDFYEKAIHWNCPISEIEKLMLCDAQTSGGLLVAIPESQLHTCVEEFRKEDAFISVIGKITSQGNGEITVVNRINNI